jgi:hypothetical protein
VALDEKTRRMLRELTDLGIEFVLVGGAAAVVQDVPILTDDVDIVHRRTPENVARLLPWLLSHHAFNRSDLANRKLPPTEGALSGRGHVLLQTDLGKLDVLCELGEGDGYEQLLPDTTIVNNGEIAIRVLGLPRLIREKTRAGRPKDKAVLPVLIATLDEQRKAGK